MLLLSADLILRHYLGDGQEQYLWYAVNCCLGFGCHGMLMCLLRCACASHQQQQELRLASRVSCSAAAAYSAATDQRFHQEVAAVCSGLIVVVYCLCLCCSQACWVMVIAFCQGRCWQARPAAQIDLQSGHQDPRVPADLQQNWAF